MTLIVCLKAEDCIVMAADSLTSLGGKVISCTTKKLHRVGTDAVTASCGLARVQDVGWWRDILGNFSVPQGTPFFHIGSELHAFLDGIIGTVPSSDVGACQGGNTFLLAGHDAANSGMAVASLTRLGDRRQFVPPITVSNASSAYYIDWIGDTTSISQHIARKNKQYAPGMSPNAAVDFAVDAIKNGIIASQAVGNHTIGGDFVSSALVSAGSVELSQHPTGTLCTVATLTTSSFAAPDDLAPPLGCSLGG